MAGWGHGELRSCWRIRENLLPLPVFLTLLPPAVAGAVTGSQLYHLRIIHFLAAVTHPTPMYNVVSSVSRVSLSPEIVIDLDFKQD